MMLKSISVNELKRNQDKFFILDVRTEFEYDEDHLDNALLIPYTELEERHQEMGVEKDTKIAIICRSGNRSLIACRILHDLGYTEVYNVEGGMLAYRNSSLK